MTDLFALMPSADEIEEWARSNKAAEYDLAELVQRLIVGTTSFTRCDIPVGKATNQSGPDGLVTSAGNYYCPAGDSVWEWGVPHPDEKANDDFNNRTNATDEATLRASTFVFVTPWKWARSRSWEAEKKALGPWQDVKVIDSSDLAGWLTADVLTHVWLSERIKGPLAGEVRSLKSVWDEWSEEFGPPRAAPPQLVLAGRDAEAALVRAWVGAPFYHPIRGRSAIEGAAFVAAAMMTSETLAPALTQAAVVESVNTWRRLISVARRPMILVPLLRDVPPLLMTAEANGHTVIQPFPLKTPGQFHLEMPVAKAADLVPVLMSMGIEAERAGKIAKDSGGLMVPLARLLSTRAGAARWPDAAAAQYLGPVAFAGRWDEALDGDREALERLAGMSYAALQAGLTALASTEDPPVRLVGSVWTATSQLDALRSARPILTATRWDSFAAVAGEVLEERGPAWDLPVQERWLANVKGKTRRYSAGVRTGLAASLAIIATQPEFERLANTTRGGASLARGVVARLLRAANEDPVRERWVDLEDELPVLAEASPNEFIDEIQRGLEGVQPPLAELFVEEPGMLVPRSRVAGLLWALERLAWSPEYLSPVVVILARLAALDPGGRNGNRPANSLMEILLPWHPQTSGDRLARRAAIEAARRSAPGPIWSTLVRLLPTRHGIAMPTSRPEWRTWPPAEELQKAPADYWDTIRDVLELLLADVGTDARRWKDLLDGYDELPEPLGHRIITSLETLGPTAFEPDALQLLSDTMLEIVGNHRAYADAPWAMPETRVATLDALASRFVPTYPVLEHLWLFEQHPSTQRVSGDDYRTYESNLAEMRQAAMQGIYAASGWTGIEDLVRRAKDPYTVGGPILALDAAASDAVLAWASSGERPSIHALAGYLWARARRDGWAWSEQFVRSCVSEVSATRLAELLLACSREPEAWALAHELGPEVERAYWSIFDGFLTDEGLWVAAEKMIEFDRPYGAIQIIGNAATLKRFQRFDGEIAFHALEAALELEVPEKRLDTQLLDHEVAEIIGALDEIAFDPERLALIEWSYLPLLRHTQANALKHIHRRLASDVDYFVGIVSAVFRAKGEKPPAEPDPSVRTVAQNAYELLSTWHGPIPGQRDDGSIDPDALNEWVDVARAKFAASGRDEIGDQRIGHSLWYAPKGDDGLHPHEAVRDLLGRVASQEIETGFSTEAFNSRGVVSRRQGGDQERELAARYGELATAFREKWPQIAGVFRGLDDHYQSLGRWEDARDELDE